MDGFAGLIASTQDQRDILQRSVTFAMSRGAKELFHTNFLSYVLEADVEGDDQQAFTDTKKKLLQLLFGVPNVKRVVTWRERRNLDLVILRLPQVEGNVMQLDGGLALPPVNRTRSESTEVAVVVVEAKLKSLPTIEQLDRYDKVLLGGVELDFEEPLEVNDTRWGSLRFRAANATSQKVDLEARELLTTNPYGVPEEGDREEAKVRRKCLGRSQALIARKLLTLATPSQVDHWDALGWDALIDCFPGPDVEEKGLLVALLKDYRQSTSALISIGTTTLAAVDSLVGNVGTLGEMQEALMDRAFSRRRIHDLVGKLAFSSLAASLIKRLDIRATNAFDVEGISFVVESYAFMTRATPGLTIAWRTVGKSNGRAKSRQFAAGVQIQRCEYRHFASASHPDARAQGLLEKWCKDLDQARTNWWATEVPLEPSRRAGLVLSPGSQTDSFCKFGAESFLYTFTDIANCSFAQLLYAMQHSLCEMRSLLQRNPELVREIDSFLAA